MATEIKMHPLKELIKLNYGKALKAADRKNGEVPVYGSNGIVGYHDEAIFNEPTVVVGRKGSVGKLNYSERPSWTIDTAYYVEIIDPKILDLKFFFNVAKALNIDGITQKGVKPGINRNDYLALEIPVPPLPEQKRIVKKLDALFERIDKAIALCEENIQHTEALMASVLNEEFEKAFDKHDTDILGNITTKIGSGATPRGGQKAYKSEGISLIRSMNVYDRIFVKDGLAFIDDDQADRLSNVVVEENDVLLNITGASVARCSIVDNNVLPARVNQHVAIIRPVKKLNPKYLEYYLTSPKTKKMLLRDSAGGATREAITKTMIQNLEVPVPSRDHQDKVIAKISALEEKAISLNRELSIKKNNVIALKSSILDTAFKGEL